MYELIEHQEVGAGGASSITFSNIPQIYTDLMLLVSVRDNRNSYDGLITIQPNGSTASGSSRHLYGSGTNVGSFTQAKAQSGSVPSSGLGTANVFSNGSIYIPNYTSSQAKSISSDISAEYNGTAAGRNEIVAALWNDSSPITSLVIVSNSGTSILEYSSITLFGVGRKQAIGREPLAIGGHTVYENGYWRHTFYNSGSFICFADMDVEYLVIAGGGAGSAAGGGAGGYRSSVIGEQSGGGASAEPVLSLTANTTYSVLVGAGGSGASWINNASSGSSSSISSIIANGGGGGGGNNTSPPTGGGSGGGGFAQSSDGTTISGAAGTANQGFGGGSGTDLGGSPNYFGGGGGGGAGEPGARGYTNTSSNTSIAGQGGTGVPSSITGSPIYRAGGGTGINEGTAASGLSGGVGGGGDGSTGTSTGGAGAVNTGGGGGGGYTGGAGGSGIVILRYKA